jgi:hypothetical protein
MSNSSSSTFIYLENFSTWNCFKSALLDLLAERTLHCLIFNSAPLRVALSLVSGVIAPPPAGCYRMYVRVKYSLYIFLKYFRGLGIN